MPFELQNATMAYQRMTSKNYVGNTMRIYTEQMIICSPNEAFNGKNDRETYGIPIDVLAVLP